MNNDFKAYCSGLTDRQLENVLQAEYEASQNNLSRAEDYDAAEVEAASRGWTVNNGERIA